MKCIVYLNDDPTVYRVPNHVAEQAVDNNHAIYVPKVAWKVQRNGQAIAKLVKPMIRSFSSTLG